MTAAAPTARAARGANGAHAAQGVNGARLPQFPGGEPGQPIAEQGIWACGDTPLPPQLWQPGGGAPGGGFGQGGVLDGMPPGPELGLLLPGAGDMAGLGDGELTGVARGWRRMGSWAAAMEHAAVAELVRRRVAEAEAGGARGEEAPRYAAAEVAAALTLTSCSADGLAGRAVSLAGLPQTWAALCAGRIDVPKALVILGGVSCLGGRLARAVEAAVVAGAGRQTTGELRKAVAAAVVAADPAAADARVAEAAKSARVERWAEPCGTAAIAGRDLPAAEALAAGNRVSALAAALKADGAPGGIDLLRAQVFLGLLLGRPVAAPAPDTAPDTAPGTPPGSAGVADGTAAGTAAGPAADTALDAAGPVADVAEVLCDATIPGGAVAGAGAAEVSCAQPPGAAAGGAEPTDSVSEAEQVPAGMPQVPAGMPQVPAGEAAGIPAGLRRVAAGVAQAAEPPVARWPGMAGSVNLTVPLRALLGQPGQPAEVAGFGPLSAAVARDLLTAAQHSPAVRWCVTVTDDHGRAAGHGCATGQPGGAGGAGGWGFTLTVRALESGDCAHRRESRGYEPAPMLRHLIQTRHRTCAFPGCGRPAGRCDVDHTVAYDAGGRTCECNLAPLCRFHHKVKQAQGWRLEQRSPGVLQWTAPSGWRYTMNPSIYPT